jgi:hypothetical protein
MTDKPTFVSEVLAGRAVRSDLEDWVSAWHDSETPQGPGNEIFDFLGLTYDEYAATVRDPSAIDAALKSRGWTSPDVDDTSLFVIRHDVPVSKQLGHFANATMHTVGDMAVSISVTAPEGLDYRQAKVVNDLFRATCRRLVDVGCMVEIRIGLDDEQHDETSAVNAILALRGETRK